MNQNWSLSNLIYLHILIFLIVDALTPKQGTGEVTFPWQLIGWYVFAKFAQGGSFGKLLAEIMVLVSASS